MFKRGFWIEFSFNLFCKNTAAPTFWWHCHEEGTDACSLAGHLGWKVGLIGMDAWWG